MNDSIDKIKNHPIDYEDTLRKYLIDMLLFIFAINAVLGGILLQIRSREIDLAARYHVWFFLIGSTVVLAVFRKKISVHYKAAFLVALIIVTAGIGFCTFGMAAASVFLFPMAMVIIAMFFSAPKVIIFMISNMLLLTFTAIGIAFGKIQMRVSADFLMTSFAHWSIYIFSMGCFFIVTGVTILAYRHQMRQLIAKVINQRDDLAQKNQKLSEALNTTKMLRGLLPICSSCKKIRDDDGYWNQLESYIEDHSWTKFSHGICPECLKEHYPDLIESDNDNNEEN